MSKNEPQHTEKSVAAGKILPKERKPFVLLLWVKLAINHLMICLYNVCELRREVMYMAGFKVFSGGEQVDKDTCLGLSGR